MMSATPPTPDIQEILRARARALARPPDQPSEDDSLLELLEFRLAHERYALETRHIREVCPLKNLTTLPTAHPFIAGIVNLRGRVLAVYGLKRLLGLPETGLTDLHRIIVVSGNDLELGLLADVSVGVVRVAPSRLASPAPASAVAAHFVLGVTEDRLIVLDVERILKDPRMVVNDEIESERRARQPIS